MKLRLILQSDRGFDVSSLQRKLPALSLGNLLKERSPSVSPASTPKSKLPGLVELNADATRVAVALRSQIFIQSTQPQNPSSSSSSSSNSSPNSWQAVQLEDDDDVQSGDVTSLAWALCRSRASSSARSGPGAYSVLLAGYQSGLLRCFDDSGTELLAFRLHAQPVLRVRMTNNPRLNRFGGDLLVVYSQVLCLVEGHSFVDSVMAKLFPASQPVSSDPEKLQSTSWRIHKWMLNRQSTVVDALVVGDLEPQDLNAEVNPFTAPSMPRFVVAGASPFLAYYTPKQESGYSMADMALQRTLKLASKLTSAVFSFATSMFGSESQPDNGADSTAEDVKANAINLGHERCLQDASRTVRNLQIDPTATFALTTDNFGRVMLVDLVHFVVVKMWKGYRGAQCGFITNSSEPSLSRAVFVVLYLGDRGVLELWRVHVGRVAAQRVCKGGLLLQQLSESRKRRGSLRAGQQNDVHTYLVRPDGVLQEVIVQAAPKKPKPPPRASLATTHLGFKGLFAALKKDLTRIVSTHRQVCLGISHDSSRWCGSLTADQKRQLTKDLQGIVVGDVLQTAKQVISLSTLLVGSEGLVPIHPSGAHQKGKKPAVGQASPLGADLCPQLCLDVLETTHTQLMEVLSSATPPTVSSAASASSRSSLRSTKRQPKEQKELEAALSTLKITVETCLHLLNAYASAKGFVSGGTDDVEQKTAVEEQSVITRPNTGAPSTLALSTFFSYFRLCAPAMSSAVMLLPSLSPKQTARLSGFLVGDLRAIRLSEDYDRVASVLTHLKRARLPSRHVFNLFFRWYSSLGAQQLNQNDDLHKRIFHVVKALSFLYQEGSDAFFNSVVRFCENTTFFKHGIWLVQLCLEVQGLETDDDDVDTASASDSNNTDQLSSTLRVDTASAGWGAVVIARLHTLELVRAYLPRVPRTYITSIKCAGDWPIARLIAIQLLTSSTRAAATLFTIRLSQSTTDVLELTESSKEHEDSFLDTSLQHDQKMSEQREILAQVESANVKALAHLLSAEFGFYGELSKDQPLVVFYAAYQLYHMFKAKPQHALLSGCVEHMAALPTGALCGGLALSVWSHVYTPLDAVVGSIRRFAAAYPSSDPQSASDEKSKANAPPRVVVNKLAKKDWNLSKESLLILTRVGREVLTLLERSYTREMTEPTSTDSGASAALEDLHKHSTDNAVCRDLRLLFRELLLLPAMAKQVDVLLSLKTLRQLCSVLLAFFDLDLKVSSSSMDHTIDELFPFYHQIPPFIKRDDEADSKSTEPAKAPDLTVPAATHAARLDFVLRLLCRLNASHEEHAVRIAEDLELSLDEVRMVHALLLFQKEDDQAADSVLSLVNKKQRIVGRLIAVSRERLVTFLQRLAEHSKIMHDQVLSQVPADQWHWLKGTSMGASSTWSPPTIKYRPHAKRTSRKHVFATTQVQSTISLLLRVQRIIAQSIDEMSPEDDERCRQEVAYVDRLLELTKKVANALKNT